MELGKIIYDYARIMEISERYKHLCFISIILNNRLKYKIYIIPKNDGLIVQYNKLALYIKREKEKLKEIINYFHDLIAKDYIMYYSTTARTENSVNNEGSPDDINANMRLYSTIIESGISYEFTLNIGNTVVYKYIEDLTDPFSYGILNFNINEIIEPLIYLHDQVAVD